MKTAIFVYKLSREIDLGVTLAKLFCCSVGFLAIETMSEKGSILFSL